MSNQVEALELAPLVEAALRHPENVAPILEPASVDDVVRLISQVGTPVTWAQVLPRLSLERTALVVESLPPSIAANVTRFLEPNFAASLIARMSAKSRERLLAELEPPQANELRELSSYPPETAGRMMDPKVMAFPRETRVSTVLDHLRATTWKRFLEIFVTEEDGLLVGSVSLQKVALAEPEQRLDELMRPVVASVGAMASREEVVEALESLKLPVLPVLDFEGHLLGAIRYEALFTAAQEETSADIQTMVGVSKDERALSKVSFAVRKRLPWLEINLGTAFLAASVVGLFESTIAQFTALAVLLPVVAGQSGNTGAQSLAVVMRGLALREIRVRQWPRVLLKEFRVGLFNGIAVAVTTAAFVFLWSRSVGLALVIGLSMVASMAIAGLAGGAIPILLTAIGQDPAQSSSIILTTVTDVVGFFSFLGIATLLSGML